jgi:hypothetical protein
LKFLFAAEKVEHSVVMSAVSMLIICKQVKIIVYFFKRYKKRIVEYEGDS